MTARLTKFLNGGALNEAIKKQLTNELNFVSLIINLLPFAFYLPFTRFSSYLQDLPSPN